MFDEHKWGKVTLDLVPPTPILREYEAEADELWEAWKTARKNKNIPETGKAWSRLKERGFAAIKCKKPFVSAWKIYHDAENGEVVSVSCAKWETLCLLYARATETVNQRPLVAENLLTCAACCEAAGEELRQWVTSGNLSVQEEYQDDTFRNLRAVSVLDGCLYKFLKKTCHLLYHALKLDEFSKKADDKTIVENSGCFLTLLREGERLEEELAKHKDDFTSHSHDTLQSFVSAVRGVFEETVPKTMVKKCKDTKTWKQALFWQRRVVENEPKSMLSWSATEGQDEYDVIVRLAREDEPLEPSARPLPSISSSRTCF